MLKGTESGGDFLEKAYKFRIYPNRKQEDLIQKTFGCTRFVYNHYLFQRIEQYQSVGKSPTYFQQNKDLTLLKKQLSWLRDVDKCALQNSLRDLNAAYQNFFRDIQNGRKHGKPKFKRKRDSKKSYRTDNGRNTISVVDGRIKLPKLGLLKCSVSKEVRGRILSATVSQKPSGKYFVSICCTDIEIDKLPKTGAIVGVDLGIKDFVVTSDGLRYPNNKYTYRSEKKLSKLQRRLSRKSKDSNNYEKARIKVARCYEHIANQRSDYIQKLTTELVRNYDVICIEDLNVAGMLKNHNIARSVADASFFEFRRELEYKSAWYGKRLSVIGRFYPSSQICSGCGFKFEGTKNLSVREWICPACGKRNDRDLNAATNILSEGISILS